MGTGSHFFTLLRAYWIYSRKWFLLLTAGMVTLELGLLSYYLVNGYKNDFFWVNRFANKSLPFEYSGALQTIRLDTIFLSALFLCLIFLIISNFSIEIKKTTLTMQRLPVGRRFRCLAQLTNAFTLILSLWMIQFLVIIFGFLMYRYLAPEGLQIDLQLFNVFRHENDLNRIFPFLHGEFVLPWVICLFTISTFPSFTVYRVRERERLFSQVPGELLLLFLLLMGLLFFYIYWYQLFFGICIELCIFTAIMIWTLFFRKNTHEKRSVEE